jgi:outer membrane protein OmpA-like peptidoglycan-associated protein
MILILKNLQKTKEEVVIHISSYRIVLFGFLLFFIGCSSPRDLTVIIAGRHQNANEFSDAMYTEVGKIIEDLITDGGSIAFVTSERDPRFVAKLPYHRIPNNRRTRLSNAKDNRLPDVLGAIGSERTIAISPENDLLAAISLANQLFTELEQDVRGEGNVKIRSRNIIIMDTGIVTTGRLDFERWGINDIIFDGTNKEMKEQAPSIAENLSHNNHLPNLDGVNITFIGLGDVATPQGTLAPNVRIGIEFLWRTIFEKAKAKPSSIKFEYPRSSNIPNTPERGFKFPVKTFDFFDDEFGFPIRILFRFGSCNYANSNEASDVLKRAANNVNRYLQTKSGSVYIYLFGSESKNEDRVYDNNLSSCRAERVMKDLEKFEVSSNKMKAYGVAVYMPSPPRREDRPNNIFDPIQGALNQKVLIVPSDIPNQVFLNNMKAQSNRLIEQQRGRRIRCSPTCILPS